MPYIRTTLREGNPATPQISDDQVACPKCGSHQIHTGMRGWNLTAGLFGMSKVVCTCLKCGYQFGPRYRKPLAPTEFLIIGTIALIALIAWAMGAKI